MSLPWNRSLHLQVAANAVRATLPLGWRRGAARAEARRVVQADAAQRGDSDEAHAVGLSEAVAAVLQDIATQVQFNGARLHVALSSELLHLDVAEGDFSDHSDRKLQTIAKACVEEMLGDEASDHDVRWHLQRDGRHLLIVAIARARLAMLMAAARAAGLRLASVRPEFVDSWNAFSRILRPGHGVFAVCAAGDLAIATVVDGTIATLSVGAGIDLCDDAGGASAPLADPLHARAGQSGSAPSRSGAVSGVISSTRPPPHAGMDTLDARVDRLLASIGQDPAQQSAFVLVAPGGQATASQRWSVVGPQGATT